MKWIVDANLLENYSIELQEFLASGSLQWKSSTLVWKPGTTLFTPLENFPGKIKPERTGVPSIPGWHI